MILFQDTVSDSRIDCKAATFDRTEPEYCFPLLDISNCVFRPIPAFSLLSAQSSPICLHPPKNCHTRTVFADKCTSFEASLLSPNKKFKQHSLQYKNCEAQHKSLFSATVGLDTFLGPQLLSIQWLFLELFLFTIFDLEKLPSEICIAELRQPNLLLASYFRCSGRQLFSQLMVLPKCLDSCVHLCR